MQNENLQIAQTIMAQIGKRALYMMGAKNFMYGFRELRFYIGRNSKKVKMVRITLNMSDYYNITFFKDGMKNGLPAWTEVSHLEDIGCEQLRSALENETGLALSL